MVDDSDDGDANETKEYEWDKEARCWRFVVQDEHLVIVGRWFAETHFVIVDSATAHSFRELSEKLRAVSQRVGVAELARLAQEFGDGDE